MAKQRTRRKHRRPAPKPATPPGTLSADPNAAPTVVHAFGFNAGDFVEGTVTDVATIRKWRETWPVVWIDVHGLGDIDMLAAIGQLFGLHQLSMEDVVHTAQRPKIEDYGRYLFAITHVPSCAENGEVELNQIGVFFGEGFVVSFQDQTHRFFEPIREQVRRAGGRLRERGADYLAYLLLDAAIDHYFPVVEDLEFQVEELDRRVFADPNRRAVAEIHKLRSRVMGVRASLAPLQQNVYSLLRGTSPLLTETTRVHLRDCDDHAAYLVERCDGLREMTISLREAYAATVANRMNEVMKVLTIIATIFIPLSFIAGVYGMNFDATASAWNMPELHWRWGYPFALLLMGATAGGMLVYFWRQGWFSSDDPPPSDERESKSKDDDMR